MRSPPLRVRLKASFSDYCFKRVIDYVRVFLVLLYFLHGVLLQFFLYRRPVCLSKLHLFSTSAFSIPTTSDVSCLIYLLDPLTVSSNRWTPLTCGVSAVACCTPKTYRACATLSRLECTQLCVGISTYIKHAMRPHQQHALITQNTPIKEDEYKSPNARNRAPSSLRKRCIQKPTAKRCIWPLFGVPAGPYSGLSCAVTVADACRTGEPCAKPTPQGRAISFQTEEPHSG